MKVNDNFQDLQTRYHNMIYSIINKFYIDKGACVLEKQDLYQEGLIALYEASLKYNEQYKASFTTFSYMIIERRILRFIKKHNRLVNHEVLSYDAFEKVDHLNIISKKEEGKDENEIFKMHDLLKKYISKLNELDQSIINGYLKNKSYEEIGRELGINKKKVDNSLLRIKRKLKEHYKQKQKADI